MATRRTTFPTGLFFDGRKGGWSYMPGHRPHVGLGGSSKSCKHCGSLLTPRQNETREFEEEDLDWDSLDMAML